MVVVLQGDMEVVGTMVITATIMPGQEDMEEVPMHMDQVVVLEVGVMEEGEIIMVEEEEVHITTQVEDMVQVQVGMDLVAEEEEV